MNNQTAVASEPILRSLGLFLKDIKISHSLFALPFAAVGLLFSVQSWPSSGQLLALLVCMVSARSFAMGMNRYLDRDWDRLNPRTAKRMIPDGQLSAQRGLTWSLLWGLSFVAAAFSLNSLSGFLSLPVLLILAGYSLMKRISWLTHWYLGFCLGMAPVAVSIALEQTVSPAVLLVGLAVCMWTAGFDILYALQDLGFDQGHDLKSVPSRFGPRRSLWISRLAFASMILCLGAAGVLQACGGVYFAGVLIVAAILAAEHWMIKDAAETGESQRINMVFFNMNAWIGVVFYLLVQIDVLVS